MAILTADTTALTADMTETVDLGDVLDQLAAIQAKTDLITTSTELHVLNRVTGSGVQYDVDVFVGEAQSVSIPSADYSAETLIAAFQNVGKDESDVATVADADIEATSNAVAFATPNALRLKPKTYKYAVRRVSNGEVLIYGTWRVLDAALADS